MRRAGSPKTRKRTVSLTIDAGLNAEALAAEIRVDLEAANTYVERNGSFADLVREHFADSGAEAV